ncbi:MAG: type IV toxin-antitoxin system AbiEi family antitoxin domain-containing protein [Cloacibacillus sp.]
MKYYGKLVELGCFSREDVIALTGTEAAAHSLLRDYLRKGLIERVRRDFYAVISIETKQPIPTRYQIGSQIFADAFISHHSAFEYYGCSNQVLYEVYVTSNSRFQDFEFDGVSYCRVASKGRMIPALSEGVRVTDIERTVVDSINDFEKIAGVEETVRCISLIPTLDAAKLLEALDVYDNGFLYQKCGWLLEGLRNVIDLPDDFFKECRRHISKSKKYLTRERRNFVLHEVWSLYAPADVSILLNKGTADYDAV